LPYSFGLSFSSEPLSKCDEPLPQGYLEALEAHKALAINLLFLAINGESINRCWNCDLWVGSCLKGEKNMIATDYACSNFRTRGRIPEKTVLKPKEKQ
jgi:hypothetical protein